MFLGGSRREHPQRRTPRGRVWKSLRAAADRHRAAVGGIRRRFEDAEFRAGREVKTGRARASRSRAGGEQAMRCLAGGWCRGESGCDKNVGMIQRLPPLSDSDSCERGVGSA